MSESLDLRQLEQDLGGRYQIVRELGRGAFGTVFLAREIALHRLVAIKALHRDRVVSAEERERFTREARTIGQLSHPGIVPLLTFGETPAVLYMVMPYVGGESLATVLRDSRRLDPDDARRILIEIADAVAYAHGQGVLHRDIKPENVLLESPPPGDDAPPRVRLIDFGVAAFPMRDRGAGATYDTWGTPNFMAPEQALGEPELDPRSELYSIGVLGYLLLTGQLPFDSTKPSARLVQQRSGPAVPLVRRAPGAPADLVTTIERCLAFEPERRWNNARELRNALMRGLDVTMPTVSLARQALRGRRPVRRTNRSRSTLVSESISAVHFTGLANDARFSFRRLRKMPGFTAAMILTLATGIGATTVVFSLFEALVLRAPALPNPGSLVVLEERHNDGHSMEMGATSFAYERYLAYAAALPTVFTGLVGQTIRDFSLRSGTDVRTVGGLVTSGNYFEVLGIRPALGRFYTGSQDSAGGAEPVVVIGYDFWQRELRGDRGVLGRSIVLDSRPMTIIGVAPRGFHGAFAGIYAFDAWVPVAAYRQSPRATPASSPRPIGVVVFGRLRPGLSAEQAHVALRVAFPRIPMRNPSSHVLDAWVEPLHALTPDSRGATAGFMTMLLAIACVVLFIAATNTAGMLLARATILRREIATRLAVGATRLRLVQQLVVESLILCALAGAIALLITTWSVRVFNAMPSPMPWALELNFSVNMRVFLFAALAVLGAGLLAGLAPAFHATRVDLAAAMKEGGMQSTVPRARLRSAFVVAQIVLSVTLLTVAALFVRSLQRALTIDPGFDAAGVVVGSLDLRPHGYDDKRLVTLLNGLLVRLSGRPEIESASFAADPPLSGNQSGGDARLPGRANEKPIDTQYSRAGVGLLELLRVPMIAGRAFNVLDGPASPRVAVINEALGRRLWPGLTPADMIGRQFELDGEGITVIGVSKTGKYLVLQEGPRPFAYLALAQRFTATPTLFIRSRTEPALALRAARQELAALDPNIALQHQGTLSAWLSKYIAGQRLGVTLIGIFGLIGLSLAATGIYGLLSFNVAQRSREFGIRMALGANAGDVVRLVLRHAAVLVIIGTVLGLGGAWAAGRLVSSFLFGVNPHDPMALIAVSLTLGVTALVASAVPVRRATAADAMSALRAD